MDATSYQPETVVTIQTVAGQAMRFDAGKGAVQVATARQSAPHWALDLYMCAPLIAGLALAGVVITAYGAAATDPSLWMFIPLHVALFTLAPPWAIGAWWRSRPILSVARDATIGCVALAASAELLWLSVWSGVYEHAPWLWWVLFWVVFAEVVVLVGGAMCVVNLVKDILGVHAHFTLFRSIARHADGQFARGDLGGATAAEPTLGAGAVALASTRLAAASDTAVAATKKID